MVTCENIYILFEATETVGRKGRNKNRQKMLHVRERQDHLLYLFYLSVDPSSRSTPLWYIPRATAASGMPRVLDHPLTFLSVS